MATYEWIISHFIQIKPVSERVGSIKILKWLNIYDLVSISYWNHTPRELSNFKTVLLFWNVKIFHLQGISIPKRQISLINMKIAAERKNRSLPGAFEMCSYPVCRQRNSSIGSKMCRVALKLQGLRWTYQMWQRSPATLDIKSFVIRQLSGRVMLG